MDRNILRGVNDSMKLKNLFRLLLIVAMVSIMVGVAAADSYHYKNLLIGERASGMAGAYTAVADDPSGIHYNPAGLIYSQGTNVSASANAYHNSETVYKGVIGGQDWTRKASALLPNFFGVVQKVGKGKMGLAYVVPDSVIEDQDEVFYNVNATVDQFNINFNNEDNTYNFGLAYAREINESMSWGASLFYHHRRVQIILNQMYQFSDGSTEWGNYYFESEEDGVRPVIGFMWTPAEKYSFGASITKTFLTGSRSHEQRTSFNPGDTNPSLFPDESLDDYGTQREYPLTINLGAAYFASDTFMVSSDVNFYTSEEDALDGEKVWLMNFAVGTEYYFSPNVAMRAGFYTNMSSTPEIKGGYTNQADHVDIYGMSLSMSHFGRGSSLSLGMSYAMGSGEAQIYADDPTINDVEFSSWTMFLSNSYGF